MARISRTNSGKHAPPIAVRLGAHYRKELLQRAEMQSGGKISNYLRPLIERHLDGEDEPALREEIKALEREIATLRADLATVFEDLLLNLTQASESDVRELVTRRLRR